MVLIIEFASGSITLESPERHTVADESEEQHATNFIFANSPMARFRKTIHASPQQYAGEYTCVFATGYSTLPSSVRLVSYKYERPV